MRGSAATINPIDTSRSYRVMAEEDDESQSSSNNSPTRADYEESDFFEGNNDSQSSIGVPTFQDMAVTEEACVPPINRLPPEVLISIFAKLSSPRDLLTSMLVCKAWAYNSVALLWHRPNCADLKRHGQICQSLNIADPYFAYTDFVKRLNLQALAEQVNDGSVTPFAACTRIERLTLTMCIGLTDYGLMELIKGSSNLLALDISGDNQITHKSIELLAEDCTKLQGLNISDCTLISNDAMIRLAERCRHLKRLKLNGCHQLDDSSIDRFAHNCPNLLEIDLHQCRLVTDAPITSIIQYGKGLRELRLASCELLSDAAFLNLPQHRTFDSLRILDLTSCSRLTDAAVEKIIDVAPRLRNLVLAKCRNITDLAVNAISKLGKNLHYVHLGHCSQISDDAVINLVKSCNRIRYIDLGCCVRLTDASVMKLATLPKLRRIGLVKCQLITDESVLALSQCSRRYPYQTHIQTHADGSHSIFNTSSLERVHLSYCTNLTLNSIIVLLNCCPRLTHLSLTGVQAFLRDDLAEFCREAPAEFTPHQREVFCVFSGHGVVELRRYLNNQRNNMELPPPRHILGRDAAPHHHHGQGNLGQPTVEDMTDVDADGEDDVTLTGDGDDDADGEGEASQMTGLVQSVGATAIGSQVYNVDINDVDGSREADEETLNDDDRNEGGAPIHL